MPGLMLVAGLRDKDGMWSLPSGRKSIQREREIEIEIEIKIERDREREREDRDSINGPYLPY